jgi:hypothetical protein
VHEQPTQLVHRRRPAGLVLRQRDEPSAPVGRRLVQVGVEQEGHEAVADLDLALGERDRSSGVEQPDRTVAAERAVRPEAREHGGRVDVVVREQPRHQPRAGELPRDIVVEVGEEPAVARAQLRRRAEPEHGRLELAEPEGRRCLVEARVEAVAARARERHRQVVRDVEAAERVDRVRIGARNGLDRRPDAGVESVEAKALAVRRGHGSRRRRPAPEARLAAIPATGPWSARRAAARRAPARGRAGARRRSRTGGTRLGRSRRPCRS